MGKMAGGHNPPMPTEAGQPGAHGGTHYHQQELSPRAFPHLSQRLPAVHLCTWRKDGQGRARRHSGLQDCLQGRAFGLEETPRE